MKKVLFWILAIVITLASAYYQRKTGPTHPKEMNEKMSQQEIKFKLPRSGVSSEDCIVKIPINNSNISGEIFYKRFPSNDDFERIELSFDNSVLYGALPKQAPAGKLEYFVRLKNNQTTTNTEHVIIRFKGEVPAWALIPHIIFMFIAMLISNLAGLFVLGKDTKSLFYAKLALFLLVLGGLIFGPIVQHYAFGQAWTGVPMGWDLTDNKTLIAVIFWAIAVWANRKKPRTQYILIASIVLFLIYIIPHSLFGSELDYSTGKVVTGFISLII
ncbi:MAG: hypothetical protein MI739_08235 [Bacteroidales bacterium]|nr:hypothetical protein [Bacteroidales bacterium]